MGGEIKQPHDRFFKGLVAQSGVADALLRERLPAELVARFGTGEPEVVPGTFVDVALRESQTDQLFRVRTPDGSPAYVYCLVEHKSSPDARIAEQLLRYLTRIWSSIAQQIPRLPLLPPVVPLVVYHGARPWPGPRRFSERLDADDELQHLLLDFPYFLFDLGPIPDETLSANPALRAGLVGMKYATRPLEQEQALPRVLLEARGLRGEAWQMEMVYILSAYTWVNRKTLLEIVRAIMPEREEEVVSLAAREWQAEWLEQGKAMGLAQGEAKGLAQGEAKGLAQGEAKGRAAMLRKILRHRFGEVSQAIQERLDGADTSQLDAWAERAIDADTLEGVFREEPH